MQHENDAHNEGEHEGSKMDPMTEKYIQELLEERQRMGDKFPCASRLLLDEVEKTKESRRGRFPNTFCDVYHSKTIKVSAKVAIPFAKFPTFNFVGKLLGPKGATLKQLEEETKCRIVVLGRGSMKDKAKENELRESLEPKYAHLNEELHVMMYTIAPPAEAYARLAYGLAEIRKYLTPELGPNIESSPEMFQYPPRRPPMPARPSQPYGGFRKTLIDEDPMDDGYMPQESPRPSRGGFRGGRGGGGGFPPRNGNAFSGGRPAGYGEQRPSAPQGRFPDQSRFQERSSESSYQDESRFQDRGGAPRGRGGSARGSGRGGGGGGGYPPAQRQEAFYMDDPAEDTYYNAYDRDDGNGGGYGGNRNQGFDSSGIEGAMRRPTQQQPIREPAAGQGRGTWKPRGAGIGRFNERGTPYSRRT